MTIRMSPAMSSPASVPSATPEVASFEAAAQVRIVSGHPDDVELAALVAGLASSLGQAEDDQLDPDAGEQWSERSRLLRGASAPRGRDTWRWSLRG